MSIIKFIPLILFSIILTFSVNAALLNISGTTSGQEYSGRTATNHNDYVLQSVKFPVDGEITGCYVSVDDTQGAANNGINCTINNDAGGVLGAVIGWGYINDAAVVDKSNNYIAMDSNVPIVAATSYWIEIRQTTWPASGNYYEINFDNSNPYADGQFAKYRDGAISYAAPYNGYDMRLAIEYTPTNVQNVTYISPTNGSRINDNLEILYNVTIDSNCTLILNGSENETIDTDADTDTYFNITLSHQGNYTYYINCEDTNTSIYEILFDSIYPIITLNFPEDESYWDDDVPLYIDFYDLYLYRTNVTIYNSSNNSVYNNESGILISETYNITTTIDNLTIGNYTLFIEATDTHTANKIKEIPYNTYQDKIVFNDGKINIEFYSLDMSQTPIYDGDRYRFTYCSDTNEFKLKIKTNSDIVYIPDSEYPCHLIIGGRYWFDTSPYKCINPKVNNEEFELELENIDGGNCITTDSLGGLNYISQETWFYTYDCTPIYGWTAWGNETNITECLSNFTLTQRIERIYYDNVSCPQSINETFYNYTHPFCNYIPSNETTTISDFDEINKNSTLFLIFALWVVLIILSFYLREITIFYFACVYGILASIYIFNNMIYFPTILITIFGLLNGFLFVGVYFTKK